MAGGDHIADPDLFQYPWGQMGEGHDAWGCGHWQLLELESGWEWHARGDGGWHDRVVRQGGCGHGTTGNGIHIDGMCGSSGE